MPRSLSSGPGKPASVLPSAAALTLSPSEKAISPPALLQQVEVLDRGLGRLHLGARALDALGVDLRQRDAERVVDARGAAGQHVDELLRRGRHRAQARARAPPPPPKAFPIAQTSVSLPVFLVAAPHRGRTISREFRERNENANLQSYPSRRTGDQLAMRSAPPCATDHASGSARKRSTSSRVAAGKWPPSRASASTSRQVARKCSLSPCPDSTASVCGEDAVIEDHQRMRRPRRRPRAPPRRSAASSRRRWSGPRPAAPARPRPSGPRSGHCARSPWASCGHRAIGSASRSATRRQRECPPSRRRPRCRKPRSPRRAAVSRRRNPSAPSGCADRRSVCGSRYRPARRGPRQLVGLVGAEMHRLDLEQHAGGQPGHLGVGKAVGNMRCLCRRPPGDRMAARPGNPGDSVRPTTTARRAATPGRRR